MSPSAPRCPGAWILALGLALVAGPALAACPIPFELEVALLVNQERAAHGIPPLEIDDRLQAAAQRHADDMADHDFMSHTGSDGSSFDERIHREGYAGGSLGENVAAGYGSPASVVQGWMNSPGHRANILRESFRHIGVGYAFGGSTAYGNYWSQSFGGSAQLVSQCAESPGIAEADCQDAQLAALGRLCRRQLGCHGRRAVRPDHPRAGERLARCLERGETRFARAWDRALSGAAASLAMCSLSSPAPSAAGELASATAALAATVMSGQDPGQRADGRLRARLLREASRLCEATADGNTQARERFDARAARAETKAARKGVDYDGAPSAAVGDGAEGIAADWISATAPSP